MFFWWTFHTSDCPQTEIAKVFDFSQNQNFCSPNYWLHFIYHGTNRFFFLENYSVAKPCIWFFAMEIWWSKISKNWTLVWFIFVNELCFPQRTVRMSSNKISINSFVFVQDDSIIIYSSFEIFIGQFCQTIWIFNASLFYV